MGDTGNAHSDMMSGIQNSFGGSLSSSLPNQPFQFNQLDIPQFSSSQLRAQMRHLSPSFGGDSSKRVGIPPSHPNQIPPISAFSQIPVSWPMNSQTGSPNMIPGPTHSRSLSQPSVFNFDSLPPLSPSPFRDSQASAIQDHSSADVVMESRDGSSHSLLPPSPFTRGSPSPSRVGEALPPRKTHRRSNSDIPFLSNLIHSSPPRIPSSRGLGGLERSMSGKEGLTATNKPIQLVKKEASWERGTDMSAEGMGERKTEGEVVDDLFSAYMNLDGIEALNSSETDDKNGNENHEDLDSRASGTKTHGGESSENEAESSVNESSSSMQRTGTSSSAEKREGIKRTAGGDIAPTTRHYRSISMDSFMEKLNFGDESPKLPPSPGIRPGQLSPSNSMDGNSNAFSLEFGNGEFSEAEMKKIMTNDKLAEIAMADPKRAKRILANRLSAARSKERKTRYISELEHKVQTLQTEATTLSAQLTLLQRDSMGLTNQNNELKFRLQAMEQQGQLRDALNEALTGEVQRLKLATAGMNGESNASKCMVPQLSANLQMFQIHQQQQPSHLNIHQQPPQAQAQAQAQEQPQQQNGNTNTKAGSNQ